MRGAIERRHGQIEARERRDAPAVAGAQRGEEAGEEPLLGALPGETGAHVERVHRMAAGVPDPTRYVHAPGADMRRAWRGVRGARREPRGSSFGGREAPEHWTGPRR